jgi:hypothetical protein
MLQTLKCPYRSPDVYRYRTKQDFPPVPHLQNMITIYVAKSSISIICLKWKTLIRKVEKTNAIEIWLKIKFHNFLALVSAWSPDISDTIKYAARMLYQRLHIFFEKKKNNRSILDVDTCCIPLTIYFRVKLKG